MRNFLLFILILLLFFSCEIKDTKNTDSITVIFDSYFPKSYKTPGGISNIYNHGFFYVDSLNKMVSYFPKKNKDTLTLKPSRDFMEIGISYRNFEEIYYYLHKGDTIILSLDSLDYPILNSKNNSNSTKVYNLNSNIRKGKTHHDMEPYVWLGDNLFLKIIREIDIIRSLNFTDLEKDYCPMDSLNKMLHDYEKDYLNTYKNYLDKGKITNDEYERVLFWLKLKETRIERQFNENKETFYDKYRRSLTDSLINYPSYHRYLHYYFRTFVDHKNVLIRTKTGAYADYRLCFDDISNDSIIPPLSKNVLLRYCLQDLSEYFPGKDVNTYLSKYLEYTGDTILANELTTKYNLTAEPNELQLKSLSGNTSNLNELIKQHKGKLLYIDFWASWCAPCKAELPYSHRLQEKYKGEDIVFVYLAYNDSEEKWKKASIEMGLNHPNSENYLITNSKTSTFITDMSINTIPRYLLYDKDGQLINENAPRPSSGEIIKLLESNL